MMTSLPLLPFLNARANDYRWYQASTNLLPRGEDDEAQDTQQAKEYEQASQAMRKCITVLHAQIFYPIENAMWHKLHPVACCFWSSANSQTKIETSW